MAKDIDQCESHCQCDKSFRVPTYFRKHMLNCRPTQGPQEKASQMYRVCNYYSTTTSQPPLTSLVFANLATSAESFFVELIWQNNMLLALPSTVLLWYMWSEIYPSNPDI